LRSKASLFSLAIFIVAISVLVGYWYLFWLPTGQFNKCKTQGDYFYIEVSVDGLAPGEWSLCGVDIEYLGYYEDLYNFEFTGYGEIEELGVSLYDRREQKFNLKFSPTLVYSTITPGSPRIQVIINLV
jgi:hypothetical protein